MNEFKPSEELLHTAGSKREGAIDAGFAAPSGQELFAPGKIIAGHYCVCNLIGSGGMSDVYLCDDLSLHRIVAVKVMRATGISSEQLMKRFKAEGQAIAKLKHKNIIEVYGLDSHSGIPFLVIEYIAGLSLAKLLEKEMTLRVERALNIAAQICDALECAHEAGIIHRDLKPSNVMIVNPGALHEQIKIFDFGIAKISESPNNLTQTGDIFGTPTYMSPEQAQGQPCTALSDQYSLGCILYEMLTGKPPFQGESQLATMIAHVNDKFHWPEPDPSIPSNVVAAVEQMLRKAPEQRFATVTEAKHALLGGAKNQRELIKHLQLIALATLLIGTFVGAIVYFWSKTAAPVASVAPTESVPQYLSVAETGHYADERFKRWCRDHPNAKQFNADNFPELKNNLTNAAFAGCTHTVPQLEDVCVKGCFGINSRVLKDLVGLPLIRLNLSKTAMSNEPMKALLSFDSLQDLNLNSTEVGSLTCATLGSMESLEALNLGGCHIQPRDLEVLAKLPNLYALTLDHCDGITGGITYLKSSHLDYLNLTGDKLSPDDVAAISKLDTLRTLWLHDTSITNDQLLQLAADKYLNNIDIAACSNIDKETELKFAARTQCHINSDLISVVGNVGTMKDSAGHEKHFTVVRLDPAKIKPFAPATTYKITPGNLIANGTFEAPVGGLWTELDAGSRYSDFILGWRVTKGSIDLVSARDWQCAEGLTCIDLNGSGPGTIEQAIRTVPGGHYVCQFMYTANPDLRLHTARPFTVSVGQRSKDFDCTLGAGQSARNMAWKRGAFEFVAPTAKSVLRFESKTAGGNGVCLDNVVVIPAPKHPQ
jgi:choice-of-anchor C domain-containing protein